MNRTRGARTSCHLAVAVSAKSAWSHSQVVDLIAAPCADRVVVHAPRAGGPFVAQRDYVEALGLDPYAGDWARLGFDWARPLEPAARVRLYLALLRSGRPQAARCIASRRKPRARTIPGEGCGGLPRGARRTMISPQPNPSGGPMLDGINHLAFITADMNTTIRFWRDLLGFSLDAGVGHDGYRHYFFSTGNNQVAFFHYEGASPIERKNHGVKTEEPRGFDHVAFTVAGPAELFDLKDRLTAAGVEVTGPVDHGTIWSIYFFDPNNLPLEASWDCVEVTVKPAFYEVDPLAVAMEGAGRQPGHWPEPERKTPRSEWKAKKGNGYVMRETFIAEGKGRMTPELEALLAEQADG